MERRGREEQVPAEVGGSIVEHGRVRGDCGRSTSGEHTCLALSAQSVTSGERLSGTSVLALHGSTMLDLLGGTHWHAVSATRLVGWSVEALAGEKGTQKSSLAGCHKVSDLWLERSQPKTQLASPGSAFFHVSGPALAPLRLTGPSRLYRLATPAL